LTSLCLVPLMVAGMNSIAVAKDPIKAEQPILITSFGQAPDGNTISVLAKRSGITTTYETLAPASRVGDFKSVIVSLGVSLKGFGAAGVNLDTEMARAAEILDTAKAKNIPVIGIHIGGSGRRDQMSNKLIEAYAGKMDMLVVYSDGNKDGVFTDIAKKNDIPIIEVQKLSDLKATLESFMMK
jgi:hypothetical protein